VETTTQARCFVLLSFEAYFEPFELGGASSGQAYVALPDAQGRAVREEVRQSLDNTGGPIAIDVDLRIASGRH
jgi:hypothetical protein